METKHRYVVMDMDIGLFLASLSDKAFGALATYWSASNFPEGSSGQYVLRIEDLPAYTPTYGS